MERQRTIRRLLQGFVAAGLMVFLCTATTLAEESAVDWNDMGVEHLNQGDREAAVKAFSKAIELDPKMALAWYHRGLAYFRQHQFKKAISDFSQAVSLRPDYYKAYLNRGHAHIRLNNSEKAFEDISQAIRIRPEDPEPYSLRATLDSRLGRHEEAVRDYTEAIKRGDRSPIDYFNRAVLLQNLNRYQEAVKDYTEVIRLKPDDTKAYAHRSDIHKALDNLGQALADAKKAAALRPENRQYQSRLEELELLVSERQPDEEGPETAEAPGPEDSIRAKEAPAFIEDLFPCEVASTLTDDREALAALTHSKAVTLFSEYRKEWSMEKLYTALNCAGSAIMRYPEEPTYWVLLGRIHSELSRYKIQGADMNTVEAYEQALDLDPTDTSVMILLGLKLAEISEYTEALTHFEEALKKTPYMTSYNLIQWMNLCYLGGAQTRRGTLYYEDLLRQNPEFYYIRVFKAILHQAHFDFAQSRKDLRQVLADKGVDKETRAFAEKLLNDIKKGS